MAEMNVSTGIRISIHVTSDTDGMATREYVKKTAQELSGQMVKQVNGESPDASGNVQVSGLPEGAGAHQQLVTDANGNAVWEERTHYIDTHHTIRVDTADGITTSLKHYQAQSSMYPELLDVLNEFKQYGLASGQSTPITVYFDGKRYDTVLFYNSFLGYLVGDTTIVGGKISNGEPFCFSGKNTTASLYFDGEGAHTFLTPRLEPETVPIDESFIPTTVPVIQSATVGQIIAVKAVDEDGKPTEWEAADIHSTQYDVIFDIDFGEQEERSAATLENLTVVKGNYESCYAVQSARFPVKALCRLNWWYGYDWCLCMECNLMEYDRTPGDDYVDNYMEFVFEDTTFGATITIRFNQDGTVSFTDTYA